MSIPFADAGPAYVESVIVEPNIVNYPALIPAFFTGHLSQAATKITVELDGNLVTFHDTSVYAAEIAALDSARVASAVAKVAAEPPFAVPGLKRGIAAPAHLSHAVVSAASGLDGFASRIASPHPMLAVKW